MSGLSVPKLESRWRLAGVRFGDRRNFEHDGGYNGSKTVRKRKELHCISFPSDIKSRVLRAEKCLRAKLQTWDVASAVHVGFEILVPTLLAILEKDDERYEFPGRRMLMDMNRSKLANFHPENLYSQRKTTLIHSLEAFVGKIDFDKVAHHLDQHESMLASPSATAAYLMNCSKWNDSAENYLRNVIHLGSGKGTGGVPSAFPSSIFETTWVGICNMNRAILLMVWNR